MCMNTYIFTQNTKCQTTYSQKFSPSLEFALKLALQLTFENFQITETLEHNDNDPNEREEGGTEVGECLECILDPEIMTMMTCAEHDVHGEGVGGGIRGGF